MNIWKWVNKKNLGIEIEKMLYIKLAQCLQLLEPRGIIKRRTDKYINQITGSSSLYEIQLYLGLRRF